MDDIINDNKSFSTEDVVLAAAIALYYPLEAVDRNDALHPQFVFRQDANLEELIEQYRCGELQVEPCAYTEQLHRMEARYFGDID